MSSHAVLWDTVYCVVGWFVKTDNFVLGNQPTKKKVAYEGTNHTWTLQIIGCIGLGADSVATIMNMYLF